MIETKNQQKWQQLQQQQQQTAVLNAHGDNFTSASSNTWTAYMQNHASLKRRLTHSFTP